MENVMKFKTLTLFVLVLVFLFHLFVCYSQIDILFSLFLTFQNAAYLQHAPKARDVSLSRDDDQRFAPR